ncbi:DUF2017 family protein [Herbiconiux sp. L3-i23]|uniref:DUF2017 family protein n=1 Tax=Herbiconiux sp. L3-i23 TaxID=2905871 RepID=UPI00206F897E|nr:DUF2017 family protein [Herbiconiux sp. L3-i23]BDI24134.1 hypothetical protein L3i23_29100 [Herbiconiux sp. L3-i23]
MTAGFVRRGDGIYRAFSEDEIRVLRGLAEGLDRTVSQAEAGDPVLARLVPDAYGADDPEASAEFAEFTRERILDAKRQRLAALTAGLERADFLALGPQEAQDWLLALNDIRLALAERIGPERLEASDLGATGEIYGWLGWLQSGLIDAMEEPVR